MSLVLALGVVIAPSLIVSEALAQTKDDEKAQKALEKGAEKPDQFGKRLEKAHKICDADKDGSSGVQFFPEVRCLDD